MKKPEKKKIDFNDYNLKPASSYLNSASDFADFLDAMKEAEAAADKMLGEIDSKYTAGIQGDAEKSAPTAVINEENEDLHKETDKQDIEELLNDLDGLVGLNKIKANVKSLINLVKVRKLRQENGLTIPPMSLHLVFMGNPGTGKTTVARLIAKLYNAIGVLSKGQLIEVDRSGLVAGYVGQTAIKAGNVINSAIGGVLFIDEAYSLASGGDGSTADFGREAIEILLKAMEDNRDDLVVIVAGYENLMEKFIASNPGLESRFNRYFIFEDYNGEELMKIFESMCSKNQYKLEDDAKNFAAEHLQYLYDARDENFGNARDVRNLFENIIAVHSDRLAAMQSPAKDDLMRIIKSDIEKAAEM